MQDYNYFHSNCFEITLELSCCKYPYARELEKYWSDNKQALLAFIEKVSSKSRFDPPLLHFHHPNMLFKTKLSAYKTDWDCFKYFKT